MSTTVDHRLDDESRVRSRSDQHSRKRRRFRTRVLIPYLMLAPAIVLFAGIMAAPILYTLVLSFQKNVVIGLGLGPGSRATVFAGLENYARTIMDPQLLASAGRVLLFAVIFIPTMLFLALLFALLLDSRRSRGAGFFRLAIFLPFAVPSVISSLLWGFLYIPGVSPFFSVFDSLGLTNVTSPLDPKFVLFAIANIALWSGVGFNMLIIYTAIKSIPSDLYEAATLDGASELQIALRIKIPIVAPSVVITGLLTVIGALQLYAEPTTLLPFSVGISSTWSPLMLIYRDGFISGNTFGASAASILVAIVTFALSLGALALVRKRAFGQES